MLLECAPKDNKFESDGSDHILTIASFPTVINLGYLFERCKGYQASDIT